MIDQMARKTADFDDYTIPQEWDLYSAAEHATWDRLFARQSRLLPGRMTSDFLAGLERLDLGSGGIPNIERLNEALFELTGWQVVCVPGKIPDDIFFDHLAHRRFPAGQFIRRPDELDYIEAPDIFHDVFGHVPMLTHPVFADYIQEYGKAGLRALELDALPLLTRVFWFTVEFGLMRDGDEASIYGAGIASSKAESLFCLDQASSHHIAFDLKRVMQSDYFIDDFQPTYFVIESFDPLFEATQQDFAPIYDELREQPAFAPGEVVGTDVVLQHGDQSYFFANGKCHKLKRPGASAAA